MPTVDRRLTEQALFAHDEWQLRDVDLILDYIDGRAGATDAAARLVVKQNWRSFDNSHEDDLKALRDYAETTLSLNVLTSEDDFVRGVRDRRRTAFRHKQQILDLFEGMNIDTLSLVHWEGVETTEPASDIDEISGNTLSVGIGTNDFRNNEALYGANSLRLTGPPTGSVGVTGFADPSGGPWTWETFVNANDGDNFIFLEIQRVLSVAAPDQTTAHVTMQVSMSNDNIVLTIRDVVGTEIETATPDTSHSPWPANPTNGWKHIAMTHDSNVFEIFFEGQRVYTSADLGVANDSTIAAWAMLMGSPDSKHLEETRMSSGVRYTGATYTVPSAPFVVD